MAIKLRTIIATRVTRYGKFGCPYPEEVCDDEEAYRHDAAVAHALIRAMDRWKDGTVGAEWRRIIYKEASKILRDQFGIEDSQP